MPEIDSNNHYQSLLSHLAVFTLISIVIVITIIAGKKASTNPTQSTYIPTPQVITPTPSVTNTQEN